MHHNKKGQKLKWGPSVGGGEELGCYCLVGVMRVLAFQDEKEGSCMGGGGDGSTLQMHLIPLTYVHLICLRYSLIRSVL